VSVAVGCFGKRLSMLTKLVKWWLNLDWSWLVQVEPDEPEQVYTVYLLARGHWYVYRFAESYRWETAAKAYHDARLTNEERDQLVKMIRECGREEIRISVKGNHA
jgi:hypothetical protein